MRGPRKSMHKRRFAVSAVAAVLCMLLALPALGRSVGGFYGARSAPLANGDSYGVNLALNALDPQTASRGLELMGQIGVGWVHISIFWSRVEPVRGRFDWRTYDALVDKAHSEGMQIVAQLGYATRWNTTAPPDVVRLADRERYPPADYGAWEDYVYRTVERYRHRIHHWEVWNEPDLRGFWGGSADQYAHLLASAYAAVKRADPTAHVLCCALSLGGSPGVLDKDFFHRILSDPAYPAARYFDAASFHHYGSKAEAQRRMDYVRSELASFGAADRPIYVTEVGYGSDPGSQRLPEYAPGLEGQAQYLTDVLPYLLQIGAHRVFWFQMADFARAGGSVQSHGLLDAGLNPKPAYYAYRDLIARTGAGSTLTTTLPSTATPVPDPKGVSYTFPQTGKTVRGLFLRYWQEHGGVMQQGYPISEEMQERSEVDGKVYTVQYFERAVFEHHPENNPPYDVLLSLLGALEYRRKYPDPRGSPGQQPNTSAGSVLFPQTGKRLGGVFLEYWRTHGGLMQQGYPISDEFVERSDLNGKPYRVQYFERAVFEYHPENAGTSYEVLLSQLGTYRFKRIYAQVPQADPWAALARRPLALPTMSASGACPVAPAKVISPDFGPALGDGPVYAVGFGSESSASLTGLLQEGGWYYIKVLWVAHPTYRGPVLVRGGRMDAPGELRFEHGQDPPRALRLHTDSAPSLASGWRNWPTYTRVRSPGCYAYQVDGPTFTDVIVFEVED